jgi:hypothetical protein
MEVHSLIDLYDHEILDCEKVLKVLNERQGKSLDLEHFRVEMIERFAEIGLVGSVLVYETNVEGVYLFEFQIEGRTEKMAEFDFDRQVHEVRNDVLDLLPPSEKGQWIKTQGGIEVPSHKH